MAALDQKIEYLFSAQVTGQGELQKLTMAVDGLRKEMDALKAANGGLAAGMGNFTKNVGNASSHVQAYQKHLDAQSKALRNTRQGTQQLGMQINDFATSVSTGASPIQAFNQQIGQVGFAMSMMGGRLGSVGRLLAGPWGAALTIGTMLLGQFIGKTDEASEKTANFGDYAIATFQSIGASISSGLIPAVEAIQPALIALQPVIDSVGLFFTNLGEVGKQVANGLIRTFVMAVNSISILASNSFGMVAELAIGTVNAGISAINGLISMVESSLNKMGGYINKIDDAFGTGFRVAEANFGRLSSVTNAYAGTAEKAFARVAAANAKTLKTDFIVGGDIAARAAGLAGARNAADKAKNKTGGGDAAKGVGKSEAEKTQEKELKSVESFMDKIGRVGMKEIPAYQREIAQLEKDFMELSKTGQAATIAPFKAAVESIEMKAYGDALKDDLKEADRMVKEALPNMGELPVSQEMIDIISRADEMNESFKAIGNSVSEAFKGMLTGAMSWKDGMRSIIGSVIDQLWKLFVVQKIVGLVSSALGGSAQVPTTGGFGSSVNLAGARAYGGSVDSNKPYMVGERGPELFVPGGNGTIIPNGNMRGTGGGGSNISVNVDARGSSDPAAVRAQVQQGILEAAPAIIAAAEARTVASMRRPRLGGVMQ